jgi:uncharacterized protein YbjT (DUF2867 family)
MALNKIRNREEQKMKILVTGGTGHVGSEVVKELKKRGGDVRVLVREKDAPKPDGVEVTVGDLLDPVSIQKALDGVDKLCLLNAVTPDELTQGLIAYDLAKKLELKHVVYHSVFRVEHFNNPQVSQQCLCPMEPVVRQLDRSCGSIFRCSRR